MPRRLWVSLGALALGIGLLATAQLAGAAHRPRQGGIFRVGIVGASVQIDPQLAYVSTAWWLEYATAAKLFNYPDRPGPAGNRLVPEIASGYRVSGDGRTWTFTIRKGFRFSDGSPVTARSFAYAIDRAANHDLASPGAQFITEPNGTNIVGAKAVSEGRTRRVRGVVAKGDRLVIRLTRPDRTLPAKLAMPFFQATSTRLPLNREVLSGYPTAGPYFFGRNDPDVATSLRRNPYYGGKRPRHLTGLDVQWNLDEEAAYQQVVAGSLDEAPLPAAHVEEVAKAYGVNKTRFWSKPTSCLAILAFNNARPLLRNNVPLRRAINWVVDRKAYIGSPYAGTPWTHLLPPTFPGSVTARRLQPYARAPSLRKARRLAADHLRNGKITVGYRYSGTSGTARAQLVRADLIKLGFKAANIKLKGFSGADIYDAVGKRSTDLDLGVGLGWCGDYALDAAFLLRDVLEPANVVGVDAPRYRQKLAAALKLKGFAESRALGRLDVEVMKDLAPIAVLSTYSNRYFFSSRVDPKSLVYENVYADWSIPALALK
jgi:ABC-type oligopeptide transport system substrate-binding subunit